MSIGTVKNEIYNKEEIINMLNDWFGIDEYQNVMHEVETGTRCKNFGNYTRVPILNENKFGRISLRNFFEDNDYGCGEILSLSELEETLSEEDWEATSHDNSYNHTGYLERDIDFQTIEGINTETAIVFYAIHVGLDVRSGYTESFAVKYDNNYDNMEALMARFNIANASYTCDGEKYEINVDGEACSEYLTVYITDEDFNQIGQNYDEQPYEIDVYGKDDFVKSITTYLIDNNIKFDKDSIKVID